MSFICVAFWWCRVIVLDSFFNFNECQGDDSVFWFCQKALIAASFLSTVTQLAHCVMWVQKQPSFCHWPWFCLLPHTLPNWPLFVSDLWEYPESLCGGYSIPVKSLLKSKVFCSLDWWHNLLLARYTPHPIGHSKPWLRPIFPTKEKKSYR
jgi:hypothetical protein